MPLPRKRGMRLPEVRRPAAPWCLDKPMEDIGWAAESGGGRGLNTPADSPLERKQGLLKQGPGNKMRMNTSLWEPRSGRGSEPERDG